METKIVSEFLSDLVIEILHDRTFRLTNELIYNSEILNNKIIVPVGFITDLASIPRIFWSVFPPYGKYSKAAVLHDFIVFKKNEFKINKAQCDLVFLEAMKSTKVNYFTRYVFYYAIKYFGVQYADNNTR